MSSFQDFKIHRLNVTFFTISDTVYIAVGYFGIVIFCIAHSIERSQIVEDITQLSLSLYLFRVGKYFFHFSHEEAMSHSETEVGRRDENTARIPGRGEKQVSVRWPMITLNKCQSGDIS